MMHHHATFGCERLRGLNDTVAVLVNKSSSSNNNKRWYCLHKIQTKRHIERLRGLDDTVVNRLGFVVKRQQQQQMIPYGQNPDKWTNRHVVIPMYFPNTVTVGVNNTLRGLDDTAVVNRLGFVVRKQQQMILYGQNPDKRTNRHVVIPMYFPNIVTGARQ